MCHGFTPAPFRPTIRRMARLLEANRDKIDTLSTALKLRGDREGQDMAWHLLWILVKAETRERRGPLFRF